VFHFFFQAEDGIRDFHVTGVQTCALPIFLQYRRSETGRHPLPRGGPYARRRAGCLHGVGLNSTPLAVRASRKIPRVWRISHVLRSEERRVGKEWRSREGGRPRPTKSGSAG